MRTIVFCSLFLASAARATEPNDFAYGMELKPQDEAPVQSLLLPPEVYRGMLEPDASDMQVFDANRTAVPFAVRSLQGQSADTVEYSLPAFPLLAPANASLDELALTVDRNDTGAIASIAVQTPAKESPVLRGYLFDAEAAGASDKQSRHLEFKRTEETKSFITSVKIEQSDDLNRWQTVTYGQTVAYLQHRDRLLERLRIPLFGRTDRYLRLTWQDGAPAPEFNSVVLTVQGPIATPEPDSFTVSGTAGDDTNTAFEFDLGGPIPVARLNLLSLNENTFAEIQWLSRSDEDSDWIKRVSGLVYAVEVEGVTLASEALSVRPTGDRYWRLEIDGKGGGLGTAYPVLEASWVPEQLLFVRRGPAPYTLAFGTARVEPESFDSEELLSVLPDPSALAEQSVTVGPRFDLGGASVLRPPPKERWKTILLWLALAGGVAFVAALGISLLGQMNREDEPPKQTQ